MAWSKSPAIPLRTDHEEDVEEAAVGLIDGAPNLDRSSQRPAFLSLQGFSLANLLLLTSNIFWVLVCTVLWQSSSGCRAELRLLHKTNFSEVLRCLLAFNFNS